MCNRCCVTYKCPLSLPSRLCSSGFLQVHTSRCFCKLPPSHPFACSLSLHTTSQRHHQQQHQLPPNRLLCVRRRATGTTSSPPPAPSLVVCSRWQAFWTASCIRLASSPKSWSWASKGDAAAVRTCVCDLDTVLCVLECVLRHVCVYSDVFALGGEGT